jgi:hypothetical protein
LIALADLRAGGKALSPNELVYNWKLGNQMLMAQSGLGRSTLTATAPVQYRDATINVTVTSQDGSAAGAATVTLTPVDPVLRIYRNGPLLGPQYNSEVTGNITLNDDEESFRAVPYYFAKKPTFAWSVNGTQSGSEQVVTVRTNGDGPGTAVLTAEATQSGTYAEAETSLGIRFGNSSGFFSFFGL